MTQPIENKTTKVQSMLRRPEGANLADICKATGWQIHSARAALSILRKKGAVIDRRTAERADMPATYHLVSGTEKQE